MRNDKFVGKIHSKENSVIVRPTTSGTILTAHVKTKRAKLAPGPLHELLEMPVDQRGSVVSVVISQGDERIPIMERCFMHATQSPLAGPIKSASDTLPAGQTKVIDLCFARNKLDPRRGPEGALREKTGHKKSPDEPGRKSKSVSATIWHGGDIQRLGTTHLPAKAAGRNTLIYIRTLQRLHDYPQKKTPKGVSKYSYIKSKPVFSLAQISRICRASPREA